MALYSTKTYWHDLRIAPDDIPEEGENVLVTVENYEGSRRVLANVFLKNLRNDHYAWCTKTINSYDTPNGMKYKVEDTMIWEEVIAWAYYPDPHVVY